MKVIVAGYPKTGTKSINAALKHLGYSVYDYLEHILYHHEEWERIFRGKAFPDDFKSMYENVDAIVDAPAVWFWKEIHNAFPEAKIILTTREEESWFRSLKNQFDILNRNMGGIGGVIKKFLPLVRKSYKIAELIAPRVTGMNLQKGFFGNCFIFNDIVAKQNYRKHNADVIQNAPQEKLLIYSVEEGWEPLCKFLCKEIPNEPFPHKNIGDWVNR